MIDYCDIQEKDFEILTEIMTEAFNDDTKMHTNLIEDGPVGYNDGTLIRKLCSNKKCISQKIILNSKIIGAYTILPKSQDTCELEMLFLDPTIKSKGIGFMTWQHIENTYTWSKKWIVETPAYSKRNYYFYTKKCGFITVNQKQYEDGEQSYIFEKSL